MGWKITLGCAIFALGFDLFLEPNSLNVGGMSGLAMVLRELLGFGQIGVITMLLNVPLFILGARKLGRKFLFGSLAGMLLSSVFIDLFSVIPAPKTEILLDSLYGGILVGLGIGLVFLSGATTGGSDIAAKLLRRRFRLICARGMDGTPRTLYGFVPDSIVYTDGKKSVKLDAYLAPTPTETGFCGFEGIAHPSAIA